MKKFITILFLVFTPHVLMAKSFETEQWDTKNGAHVVFYQTFDVPMLDINVAFAAGSAYDNDNFGLSALTTSLLKEGSKGLNATQIAENLADTGAQFDSTITQDMVVLSLRTLTRKDALQKATEIFATIVAHPDFPQTAFVREKNQQLMSIDQLTDSPDDVANQLFFQALYKKHPYAHPIQGDKSHVTQLNINQVRSFYKRFFVSKNALIVLVGAIDKETARHLAEQVSQDLTPGLPAPSMPLAKSLTEEINIEVPFASSQTILRLGQLGITHHDSRYFPLIVGNYIFGGGALVSRLGIELREKQGLTYGVSSQFSPMPGIGPYIIGLSTKNRQKKLALDTIHKSLTSFLETGPDEEELKAAKQYLTGSFPLALASNSSIASMLLKISFYHLPNDYLNSYVDHINAVTKQDIKNAFQELIIPNKLLQISVGKQATQ